MIHILIWSDSESQDEKVRCWLLRDKISQQFLTRIWVGIKHGILIECYLNVPIVLRTYRQQVKRCSGMRVNKMR
jgi:hypothetical protein